MTLMPANPTSIVQTSSEGSIQLLGRADEIRREAAAQLDPMVRSQLGQFLTPKRIASLLSSFVSTRRKEIRILDPGAGSGALCASLVARLLSRRIKPKTIRVTAFEIDNLLIDYLLRSLEECEMACQQVDVCFQYEIKHQDYIKARSTNSTNLFHEDEVRYDCVIMNPPYRKIKSASNTRQQLRSVGIETSNLYSAFMLLSARQLDTNGEFVSINPRSFCNGPYFRPFRREFLKLISIRGVHVFESRSDAFKEDEVLQENIIVYGVRSSRPANTITISHSRSDGSINKRKIKPSQLVQPDDFEKVIHIVIDELGDSVTNAMEQLKSTLSLLGLSVSTGRVVDFRAKEHLRQTADIGTVPLIYPAHFHNGQIVWPNGETKKPNAIRDTSITASLLVPAGFYVLIKRFSAKEERRRVVAAVYDPNEIVADRVGFENKTNYIHCNGEGLSPELAHGIAVFLNSRAVDDYFRLFSGHTQVNAADLRRLPFPSHSQLIQLSKAADPGDSESVENAVDQLLKH